jgi:hypothetical protein
MKTTRMSCKAKIRSGRRRYHKHLVLVVVDVMLAVEVLVEVLVEVGLGLALEDGDTEKDGE